MLCTSMLYIFARATADKVAIRGVRRAYFQLCREGMSLRRSGADAALSSERTGSATMLRRAYYCEISKRLPG